MYIGLVNLILPKPKGHPGGALKVKALTVLRLFDGVPARHRGHVPIIKSEAFQALKVRVAGREYLCAWLKIATIGYGPRAVIRGAFDEAPGFRVMRVEIDFCIRGLCREAGAIEVMDFIVADLIAQCATARKTNAQVND